MQLFFPSQIDLSFSKPYALAPPIRSADGDIIA